MPLTRAFKSGNSQAIRIPADLAYADTTGDLTITRCGEVITIYPARTGFDDMIQALRDMPKPATIELLERIEVPERDGN